MGRNKTDFESCPECYGQGHVGWSSPDGEYSIETCPTCEGKNAKSSEDRIEESMARAAQRRGK